jgi:hypothetical protein
MIGVNQAKVMSAYVAGVPIANAAWDWDKADAPWDLAKSMRIDPSDDVPDSSRDG